MGFYESLSAMVRPKQSIELMMDEFLITLRDITLYISFVYPLLYLVRLKNSDRPYKYFTAYLVVMGLIQLGMLASVKWFGATTNIYFFHYYFISQFILLSLFYEDLLKYKWIHVITGLVLCFLVFQYIKEPEMYYRYNPLGSTITQIILVAYALLYMYKSLSGSKIFVIVNAGLLVYLLSSILIFASGNMAFDINFSISTTKLLTNINSVLYFVFQILIFIEWYKNYRFKKSIES